VIALQHDGIRGRLGMFMAARVGPSTSTLLCTEARWNTTRMQFRVPVFLPDASKRGARNQMWTTATGREAGWHSGWAPIRHAVVVDPAVINAAAIGRGHRFGRAVAVEKSAPRRAMQIHAGSSIP